MKKAIEMKISGIKCDACDWKDMSVPYDEYDSWLNKPCPKCGANLLTEADYNTTKFLMYLTDLTNKFFPARDDEEIVTGKIEMNGTGSVDIKINN